MRTVEVSAVCDLDEVRSHTHEAYSSIGKEKRVTETGGDTVYI